MRPGMNADWQAALAAERIVTHYLARLDFASETVFVWTGYHSILVAGTGDELIDGNEFHPIQDGILSQVGENSFSLSGSEALELVLTVPTTVPDVLVAASLDPSEYMARPATIWRGVQKTPAGPGTQAVWMFKRNRTGKMDNLEIQHSTDGVTYKLNIEAYAASATAATASGYIDQKQFDASDTSQTWASSAQNDGPGTHHQPTWRQILATKQMETTKDVASKTWRS